jgi:hypothetical protein
MGRWEGEKIIGKKLKRRRKTRRKLSEVKERESREWNRKKRFRN